MRKARVAVAVLVAVLGLGQAVEGIERKPSFRGVGYHFGARSEANGISADGNAIVGFTGGFNHIEGFVWTEETGMVPLGYLKDVPYHSSAKAVSGDGSVIVGHNATVPVRWTKGKKGKWRIERLPLLEGGRDGYAEVVSDDGRWVFGRSKEHQTGYDILVRWDAQGNVHNLGLPGESEDFFPRAADATGSAVVGFTITTAYPARDRVDGYRWREGVGFDLLINDPIGASARAMTPDGMFITGSAFEGRSRGFRLECDASIVWLTYGENDWITPLGISADGSIIVGTDTYGDNVLIWDADNGTRRLKDVLVGDFGLDLAGWQLFSVAGISDDGMVIAGTGYDPAGFRQAWVAVIPEPGGVALLMMALGAYLGRRRRG